MNVEEMDMEQIQAQDSSRSKTTLIWVDGKRDSRNTGYEVHKSSDFQLLVTFKEKEDEVRQGMEEDAGGRI